MKKEELKKILEQHELWLNSNSCEGKRAVLANADLRSVDLQRAYLYKADLQGAYLRGADLRRANLRDVNLQNADLQGANLRGANLRGADLLGVNLQSTNLKDAYISYKEKPNVPILLGNILVTEVLQPGGYWWRVITWVELKPNEMEMAELLYG